MAVRDAAERLTREVEVLVVAVVQRQHAEMFRFRGDVPHVRLALETGRRMGQEFAEVSIFTRVLATRETELNATPDGLKVGNTLVHAQAHRRYIFELDTDQILPEFNLPNFVNFFKI